MIGNTKNRVPMLGLILAVGLLAYLGASYWSIATDHLMIP